MWGWTMPPPPGQLVWGQATLLSFSHPFRAGPCPLPPPLARLGPGHALSLCVWFRAGPCSLPTTGLSHVRFPRPTRACSLSPLRLGHALSLFRARFLWHVLCVALPPPPPNSTLLCCPGHRIKFTSRFWPAETLGTDHPVHWTKRLSATGVHGTIQRHIKTAERGLHTPILESEAL